MSGKRLSMLSSAIWGAAVGLIVLGIWGRIATALVAVILGLPANFTLASILVVMLLGTLYGAAGGLLFHAFRIGGMRRGAGLVVGGILFILSLAMLKSQPGTEAGAEAMKYVSFMPMDGGITLEGDLYPVRAFTLAVVALIYLAYGFILERLVKRQEQAS